MSRMAKTTRGSILGVILKVSWILDHFEICLAELAKVCALRVLF